MPHKAQLLLQLAQAAAKVETRQQGVLPSVAVNVWDTLTGSHAAAGQQPAAGNKAPAASGHPSSSAADHRLSGGLGGFLHLAQGGHPAGSSQAQQLLAQQAAALHSWGIHPGLAGNFAADTAVLYDNSSWAGPQHGMPGPLMHAAAFPGLPRPSAAAGLAPSNRPPAGLSTASTVAPVLGGQGPRKSRFNNSISLNKQIMNTHNARDLHTIVRSKGGMFDFFNISSAIARVPKLVASSGGVQVGGRASLVASRLLGCAQQQDQL